MKKLKTGSKYHYFILRIILCLFIFKAHATICTESQNQDPISPCNHLQNPYGLIGFSTRSRKDWDYQFGLSSVFNSNIMPKNPDQWGIGYVAQVWGESPKWAGFSLGGAVSVANIGSAYLLNPVEVDTRMAAHTTGVIMPNQAYINYQASNVFDIAVGNIILQNPWVTSAAALPPYALTNTFQGASAHLQVLPNLSFEGFAIFSYQLYPNNYWTRSTNYNELGSVISWVNDQSTPGAAAIGAQYNPIKSDTLNIWLYQFYDYVNMFYADNEYNLQISKNVSMNFAGQIALQNANGSNIVAQQFLDGTKMLAGTPGGKAIGLKWDINIPHNTFSFSYNNVFGSPGSFLNGGLISPYTYGFETDPLYTTPALGSMAELGSGSAFTFRDKMSFFNDSLKFVLSYSSFWINKIYPVQPEYAQEFDAVVKYTLPHTKFSTLGRLVFYQLPDYAGGNVFQPRVIVTYVF